MSSSKQNLLNALKISNMDLATGCGRFESNSSSCAHAPASVYEDGELKASSTCEKTGTPSPTDLASDTRKLRTAMLSVDKSSKDVVVTKTQEASAVKKMTQAAVAVIASDPSAQNNTLAVVERVAEKVADNSSASNESDVDKSVKQGIQKIKDSTTEDEVKVQLHKVISQVESNGKQKIEDAKAFHTEVKVALSETPASVEDKVLKETTQTAATAKALSIVAEEKNKEDKFKIEAATIADKTLKGLDAKQNALTIGNVVATKKIDNKWHVGNSSGVCYRANLDTEGDNIKLDLTTCRMMDANDGCNEANLDRNTCTTTVLKCGVSDIRQTMFDQS